MPSSHFFIVLNYNIACWSGPKMHTISTLADVEHAIQISDPKTRHETLRAVTDLFLSSCTQMKDEQVEVFDEVFGSLLEDTDASAAIETSRRLAPLENSPPQIIKRLANDDAIEVAAPVLQHSPRLTTNDLHQIASTKGNGHLLAISKRRNLEEVITDVLITRGDASVSASVAGNTTATLSQSGLQTLVAKARKSDEIADRLVARRELSPDALNSLLVEHQNREAERASRVAAAQRAVVQMKQEGRLNDTSVREFASTGQIERAIAAISLLSGLNYARIESLLNASMPSGFILVGKAVDFTWETISKLLKCGKSRAAHSEADMKAMYADFMRLSKANAGRICGSGTSKAT